MGLQMPSLMVAALIFYLFLCPREEVRTLEITSFALMLIKQQDKSSVWVMHIYIFQSW